MKMWPVCNKMCTVLLLRSILSPVFKHGLLWDPLPSLWKPDARFWWLFKYITILIMLFSVRFPHLLLARPTFIPSCFFPVLLLLAGAATPIPVGIEQFATLLMARIPSDLVPLRPWGTVFLRRTPFPVLPFTAGTPSAWKRGRAVGVSRIRIRLLLNGPLKNAGGGGNAGTVAAFRGQILRRPSPGGSRVSPLSSPASRRQRGRASPSPACGDGDRACAASPQRLRAGEPRPAHVSGGGAAWRAEGKVREGRGRGGGRLWKHGGRRRSGPRGRGRLGWRLPRRGQRERLPEPQQRFRPRGTGGRGRLGGVAQRHRRRLFRLPARRPQPLQRAGEGGCGPSAERRAVSVPSRPVPSLRLGLPSSPGSGRERRAFRGCPADGARGRRPFPVRAVPLRRLHGLGGEGGEFRAGGGAAGVSSRLRLTWAGDGKAAGFLRSWR